MVIGTFPQCLANVPLHIRLWLLDCQANARLLQSGAWEEQRQAQCAEMDAQLDRALAAKTAQAGAPAPGDDIKADPEAAAQALAASEGAAAAADAQDVAEGGDQADPFNLDALLPGKPADAEQACAFAALGCMSHVY